MAKKSTKYYDIRAVNPRLPLGAPKPKPKRRRSRRNNASRDRLEEVPVLLWALGFVSVAGISAGITEIVMRRRR